LKTAPDRGDSLLFLGHYLSCGLAIG